MTTLTQTSYLARRLIKYGILAVIFLLVARVAWIAGVGLYRRIVPPPPPTPTVEFGRLPAIPFPQKAPYKYNFLLQTPTGDLPSFPTLARVYFMPEAQSSFLDLDNATRQAHSLGFTGKVTPISETIYKFENLEAPASLDMNIINKTFSLNYNLTSTPELINLRPRSTQEALAAVNSFLSSGGFLTKDLAAGTPTFEFIKVEPPNLVGANSLSEASFIQVNLFRSLYDELPVLTPDRKKSNVWFLVSGETSSGRQIITGEYHYFPVEAEHSSTYPLKTAQVAWEELVAGKGFIASLPTLPSDQIVIRRVYLGYYDGGLAQKFLQPIVVFEGDNEFQAFVPAVTSEYYSQE